MSNSPKAANQQPKLVPVKATELFGLEKDIMMVGYDQPHALCPKHLLDENYKFQPMILGWLVRALMLKKHIMLVGPHGTGKSSHAVQTLIRLNYGFPTIKGSSDVEPCTLFGHFGPNEDGKFQWIDGPVTTAARLGIPVLIEERDAIMADASVALNSVVDGMPIDIPETGERIVPKEGFMIVATGNTAGSGDESGNYVTSKQQPLSAIDRLLVVEVDYLDKETELEVLKTVVPQVSEQYDLALDGINASLKKRAEAVDQDVIEFFVNYANVIRAACKSGKLDAPLSTRALKDATMFVGLMPDRGEESGATGRLEEVMTVTYWNKISRADAAVARELFAQTSGAVFG